MKNLENTNRMLIDLRDSIDRIIGTLEKIDESLDTFFHENNAQLLSSESSHEDIDAGSEQQKESSKQYDDEKLYQMRQYHLDSVEQSTGKLTLEDYHYCHNLLNRIRVYQSSQNPG